MRSSTPSTRSTRKRQRPISTPLLALVTLLFAGTARAVPWRGVEPGISTRPDVIEHFGEPTRTARLQGGEVLTYRSGRGVKGMRQVEFRINVKSQLLEQINVFPQGAVDRAFVEDAWGPACLPAEAAADQRCYLSKLSQGRRVRFVYPSLGLTVFFKSDGRTVYSYVYAPVEHEAVAAEATPAETGGEVETTPQDGNSKELQATDVATDPSSSPDPSSPSDGSEGALTPMPSEPLQEMLKIGGALYMRGDSSLNAQTPDLGSTTVIAVAMPVIADVFFDGRPNDRLRGFCLGRLMYDPTHPSASQGPTLPTVFDETPAGLQVLLDQLWLKFDLGRFAYVTIGRQHAKWGSSRIWTLVDFLTPTKRAPLSLFDSRLGVDMVKVHIPWQTRANFYAVGLLDPSGFADSPVRFGGAFRAEAVVLGAEVAASTLIRQGKKPMFGFDVSSPIGPVDVHAEVALQGQSEFPVWRYQGEASRYPEQFELSPLNSSAGPFISTSAGVEWAVKPTTEVDVQLGLEAYYNALGYEDFRVLPWLFLQRTYQPLYGGRYYAAAYAAVNANGVLDRLAGTVYLIANLSDRSFLSWFNLSFRVLSDLTVEAYVGVPFGTPGGELNLTIDIPRFQFDDGQEFPGYRTGPRWLQLGLALRIGV